jgi:2-oxo-4-hydroxy-4-carboxy-5-ureidoimidazoline decarboxylase
MDASQRVDAATPAEARRLLTRCCGSPRWVERMLARRPFGSTARLLADAREIWFALDPEDWREAFLQHPEIGDRAALEARFSTTRHLSQREQAGVGDASDAVLERLERGNYAYQSRFGFIFIVCATGKSAEEMLMLLESRLANTPEIELRTAAEEESKITAIRLAALGEADPPPED